MRRYLALSHAICRVVALAAGSVGFTWTGNQRYEGLRVVTTGRRAAGTANDAALDVSADVETLDRDGIVGRKGAFETDWVDRLREDMEAAFTEARGRERGAVSRGP